MEPIYFKNLGSLMTYPNTTMGNQPVNPTQQGSSANPAKRRKISGAQQRKRRRANRHVEAQITTQQQNLQPYTSGAGSSGKELTRSDYAGKKSAKKPRKFSHRFKGNRNIPKRDKVAGIRMAIVHKDYPFAMLSGEQLETLTDYLERKVDEALDIDIPPTFESTTKRDGALIIVCADQSTKNWLATAVSESSPWENAELRLVEEDPLQPRIKAMVYVQGPEEEPEVILYRIAKQNKLSTTGWKVMHSWPDHPKGHRIVVLMDQTVWAKINALACKQYYKLGRVTFELLKKSNRIEMRMGESSLIDPSEYQFVTEDNI